MPVTNRNYCCDQMQAHSELSCDLHSDPHDCPDVQVIWSAQHGPGLPIRDGGRSILCINFCPWCGTNLSKEPTS